MSQQIINGDSAKILKTITSNTIDAVITDPPYGIEFLAKEWDRNTGAVEIWQECLRVLKPGGYLLAFSAARTYHQLATNIESVGFEIRDQIMWLYSSGFPKAQDIGKAIQKRQGVEKYHTEKGTNAYPHTTKNKKMVVGSVTADDYKKEKTHPIPTSAEAQQWSGWKTALKPAHEPICMARKPFRGSTIDTMLTHGVGALNIDATRIASEPFDYCADGLKRTTYSQSEPAKWNDSDKQMIRNDKGRYPSNVIGEVEGYQKFFYCPKVSRKERHRGFEQMPDPISNYSQGDVQNHPLWDPSIGTNLQRLKHKIMEHNRDVGPKLDPLSHIPTNPDGMYAKDENGEYKIKGRNYMYIAEQQRTKKDPLSHIPTSKGGMLDKPTDGSEWVLSQHRDEKARTQANVGNNHPTVKPVELMKYLVKLVTPAGAHIIDPFAGSGSTGMACRELGRQFTGIDLDSRYCEIAERRIAATQEDLRETLFQ